MNKHLITGNLTKDPEFKVTNSGKPRCSFTVACQRPFKNTDGKYDTDFITCVAWEKTAEFIHSYFTKGQSIEVEGWVKVDKYTDNSGNTRWTHTTVVTHAGFNGLKRDKDVVDIPQDCGSDEDSNIKEDDFPF